MSLFAELCSVEQMNNDQRVIAAVRNKLTRRLTVASHAWRIYIPPSGGGVVCT